MTEPAADDAAVPRPLAVTICGVVALLFAALQVAGIVAALRAVPHYTFDWLSVLVFVMGPLLGVAAATLFALAGFWALSGRSARLLGITALVLAILMVVGMIVSAFAHRTIPFTAIVGAVVLAAIFFVMQSASSREFFRSRGGRPL